MCWGLRAMAELRAVAERAGRREVGRSGKNSDPETRHGEATATSAKTDPAVGALDDVGATIVPLRVRGAPAGPLPACDVPAGPRWAPRTSTFRKGPGQSPGSPPASRRRWRDGSGRSRSSSGPGSPLWSGPSSTPPATPSWSCFWAGAKSLAFSLEPTCVSRPRSPPAPAGSRCSTPSTRSSPLHLQPGERSPSQARPSGRHGDVATPLATPFPAPCGQVLRDGAVRDSVGWSPGPARRVASRGRRAGAQRPKALAGPRQPGGLTERSGPSSCPAGCDPGAGVETAIKAGPRTAVARRHQPRRHQEVPPGPPGEIDIETHEPARPTDRRPPVACTRGAPSWPGRVPVSFGPAPGQAQHRSTASSPPRRPGPARRARLSAAKGRRRLSRSRHRRSLTSRRPREQTSKISLRSHGEDLSTLPRRSETTSSAPRIRAAG